MGFEEREKINGILRTRIRSTFNMLAILDLVRVSLDVPEGFLKRCLFVYKSIL